MVDMAVFPLFIRLNDRKCVVVGGGRVAYRKICSLLEFDAKVTVITAQALEEVQELWKKGRIKLIYGSCFEKEIENAFLVLAATSDRELNSRIYRECAARGIFVNVADSPEECTFIFPSVVKKGDVVVGISTSGGSPALAKQIRQRIEKVFPGDFEQVADIIVNARKRVMESIQDLCGRDEVLKRIAEKAQALEGSMPPDKIRLLIDKIIEEFENGKKDS
jgi:precorrin-2 dehydrogenase/sirohydrochlorin ferrochelatase